MFFLIEGKILFFYFFHDSGVVFTDFERAQKKIFLADD